LVDLRNKFRGAMIGVAVGDALGKPIEGRTIERIRSELGEVKDMLKGTWTDDTAMTIAVAESLIECQGFNAVDMRKKFLKHYDPKRGYGITVKMALGKLTEEEIESKRSRIEKALRLDIGTFNGSAMRIAPIGLFYHDDPVKLRFISYESSKITHGHIIAHEGAALQAYAIACLVKTETGTFDPNNFLMKLEEFVHEYTYKDKLLKIRDLMDQSEDKQKIIDILGNTVQAHRSVPTAIYSFITHHENFKDAVLYAVNLGGDSDTIASMTGALCGAYLGVESIPLEWRNTVENTSYLTQLADKLYQLKPT